MELLGLAAIMGVGGIVASFTLLITFIVFWIKALIEVINGKFKDENNKIIWLILLITIAPIGTILFYIIGRQGIIRETWAMKNDIYQIQQEGEWNLNVKNQTGSTCRKEKEQNISVSDQEHPTTFLIHPKGRS